MLAGVGLVSALGYDAPTALAAARAGLSRACAQAHWRQRSGVTGLEEAVAGHSADLLTLGFAGDTRLLRLAQGALNDLLTRGMDAAQLQQRVGLFVAMPDPGRTSSCQALMPEGTALDPAEEGDSGTRMGQRVQALTTGIAWPQTPCKFFWSHLGHAAGAVAMAAATQALLAGQVDTAIVLAADSMLDDDTLCWLAVCGRLKCDDAPAGLMPGEAAVALALRRGGEAAQPLARLHGLALAEEPLAQGEGRVSSGEVLAAALAQTWSAAPSPHVWMLGDHNGEIYRANEWGSMLARLRAVDASFADPAIWFPALSFGDTGAASMPLAVAMASQAWQRRYAPGPAALVAACADGGERATLMLCAS